MERLTVRNENGSVRMAQDCSNGCDYLTCSMEEGYHCEHQCEADAMCKLADYEDAEEQGLLLRLPCKVGDTVFLVQRRRVYERKVSGFSVTSNNRFVVNMQDCEMDNATFLVERFGETLFLTREEAESALAEKGGAE